MRFGRRAADVAAEQRHQTPFEAEALSFLNHLYASALRLTRDHAAAEDLVQDTYLKAFRFASQYQPGTNLKAWLFAILHNTFRNDRRGAQRNPVEIDSEVVASVADRAPADSSPEAVLLRRSLAPDLQDALASLPEAFRQAVWLRDVEELSYAEIARVLDVPIGTVMSRISRGRRQLSSRLSARRPQPAVVETRS